MGVEPIGHRRKFQLHGIPFPQASPDAHYLFSGSADAARRLAGVYSLVCSCQNLGINTRLYLTDIITKLLAGFPLRDINRLRPDIWATEHPTLVSHQLAQ